MNNNYEIPIQIDTEKNSPFLNKDILTCIQHILSTCSDKLSMNQKKRMALKNVQNFFEFKKVFKNRGVQGITGILKVRGMNEHVVFKVSVDLDKTVDHENIITKELNKLRDYCPHFVGNIGLINLPVSNDFINNPELESLFKNSNDYFPCNVLIIEYVSPISLYHVCKYLNGKKGLIISQILQILIALDIAQQKCKLTHYDLHLDNILIRNCEENALFLYIHKDKHYLIPTYGLYPVIIDLGTSYIENIEGSYMYTSADNYNNGLQPTLYDNLNDMHHLLLSAFYYLEDKGYAYDFIRNRLMYYFRHIPIMAQKGWKQLPNDILDNVLDKINAELPELREKFIIFKAFQPEIIEILNGLILLPWVENEERNSFKDCLPDFLTELQKIVDIKTIESEYEILYIIRETVDLINNNRKQLISQKEITVKKIMEQWKARLLFIVKNNMKFVPKDFNFEKFIFSAIDVAEVLSSHYYNYTKKNVEIINDSYMKTDIKSPIDIIEFLIQNATPSFDLNKDSKIYVWNTVNQTKTIHYLNSMDDDLIDTINRSSMIYKGKILAKGLGLY